jgi:hypothetical protein
MQRINGHEAILIWLAGFNRKTAELCTGSEIRKMTIAGSMVLIPPLVGLFSYGYAFYFLFNNLLGAIIGGVLSAIVLLLIDRSIMAYGRPGSISLGMLGRVLLALSVGLMLAEPIILKVFEDSIGEQQHQDLVAAQQSSKQAFQEEILAIQDALQEQEGRLHDLQTAYTLEMDGRGSNWGVGQGSIYQKKLQDYEDYKDQYLSSKAAANEEIAAIEIQMTKQLEALAANKATGLIGRMRALHTLGQQEPIVEVTTWLLRIFFVLIELIPLLIKISPAGDRGLYYKLVDTLDQEREAVLAGLSKERQHVAVQEKQVVYAIERAALSSREQAAIIAVKAKDAALLMDEVLTMVEQKIIRKQQAAQTISDPALLEQVYHQIDAIFEDFIQTVDQLHDRPVSHFLPEKNLSKHA